MIAKAFTLVMVFFAFGFFSARLACAQMTVFTYQGSLKDGANLANGNYDFEFALFDALSGGNQIGSTLEQDSVAVSNGIFSVNLNFGSQFPGENRFLEVRVRQSGSSAFTTLNPRQAVNSAPYSLKSLNADAAANATTADNFSGSLLGDVTGTQGATVIANNAVTTTKLADGSVTDAKIAAVSGSKVTGTVPISSVPAGSNNYVQNTTTQQASSSFNISGTGTANVLNATGQFNLNGARVFSTPGSPGSDNLAVGIGAGATGVGGTDNSLFGFQAGFAFSNGSNNSFFGSKAGTANDAGSSNSFFGANAGSGNRDGSTNSFFGNSAGHANTSGNMNSFFGDFAGLSNVTGSENSFFGDSAGKSIVGSQNSFFGSRAGWAIDSGSDNTAVGYSAGMDFEGLSFATAIGAGAIVSTSNRVQLGRLNIDTVAIGRLATGGSMPVCTDGTVLASCASSRRYKENILPFNRGLNLIRRLQPVTFDWKEHKERDLGLIAEEVAKIEPLLVTHNLNGEVEGVKYNQLSAVLVNAIREQQAQIESLRQQNESLRRQVKTQTSEIDAIKRLVCSHNRRARACRATR